MASGKSRLKKTLTQRLADEFPDKAPKDLYASILCGEVLVDGGRIRDPKAIVAVDSQVVVQRDKYVGRGGYKLEGALDDLGLNPKSLVCLDAGASTGGFTDCLLARGAAMVYAVDVGFNQLAWKLRSHTKVISREKTNLMSLGPDDFDPRPTFAVADLSFRSLRGAASKLLEITGGGKVLALVKPQFEDHQEVDFDGVLRSGAARRAVLESLKADLPLEGVYVLDASASKVTGRKGNAEIFLLLGDAPAKDETYTSERIIKALDDAEAQAENR